MAWFLPQTTDRLEYVCLCDPAIDWGALGLTPWLTWGEHDAAEILACEESGDPGQHTRALALADKRQRALAWQAFEATYDEHPDKARLKFLSGAEPAVFVLRPPTGYAWARGRAGYSVDLLAAQKAGREYVAEETIDWQYASVALVLAAFPGEAEGAVTLARVQALPLAVVRELAHQAARLASPGEGTRKNS